MGNSSIPKGLAQSVATLRHGVFEHTGHSREHEDKNFGPCRANLFSSSIGLIGRWLAG